MAPGGEAVRLFLISVLATILAVLTQLVGTEFEFVALAPAQGSLIEALQSVGVPTLPFDVRDAFGMRRPVERLDIRSTLQAKTKRLSRVTIWGLASGSAILC